MSENTNENSVFDSEEINETGSVSIKSEKGSIHCLTIVGQIEAPNPSN